MTRRHTTMDLPLDADDNPVAGDLVARPRKVYRVTEARLVDSRVWENRWHLTLELLGTRAEVLTPELDARVWFSIPYRPGETPASVFGGAT